MRLPAKLAVICFALAFLLMALNTWAHAAVVTSPKSATCAAFAVWNHHHTTANLNHLMTASEYAPWNPLGNDVVVVYSDMRTGNRTDLPGDVSGLASDCKG
jgi:hypothetical protein